MLVQKVLSLLLQNNLDDFSFNLIDSQAECEYLGNNRECYKVEEVNKQNISSDYRKKISWYTKIDNNVFIKIKEYYYNSINDLLYSQNFEYKKETLYYIISKRTIENYKLQKKMIINTSDIEINSNISEKDFSHNFLINDGLSNKEFYDSYDINAGKNNLDSLLVKYNNLFPKDVVEDIEEENNQQSNEFEWNQSTKQYFYFVEDATINGLELTENDWMVAYNNNIIVALDF